MTFENEAAIGRDSNVKFAPLGIEGLAAGGNPVDGGAGGRYKPPLAQGLFRSERPTIMANHKSAEKRARQTIKRTEVNRARRSRVRTAVKRVESALAAGDAAAALAALKIAQPELDKGVSNGVIKRNTASRKVSRLTHKVRELNAAK